MILAPTLAAAAAQQPKSQPKPLFSEDFESGAIDPNLWTQDVTGDAILTVQSDKAAHAGGAGYPHSRFFEIATSHANFQTTFTDQVDSAEDWHPSPTVPLGRWFLLEWEFNDQPDQETLWVDGQQIMDSPFTYKSTTQSTGLIGAFTEFSVGFLLRGAAPVPFDIYYDDIAMDTHRLGPIK